MKVPLAYVLVNQEVLQTSHPQTKILIEIAIFYILNLPHWIDNTVDYILSVHVAMNQDHF